MRQKVLTSLLPVIVLLCPLTANISFAQFREILPDENTDVSGRQLTPTRQPFVSPNRKDKKTSAHTEVAKKANRAQTKKSPTLAVPAEPKPALKPAPKTLKKKQTVKSRVASPTSKATNAPTLGLSTPSADLPATRIEKKAVELPSAEKATVADDISAADDQLHSIVASEQTASTETKTDEQATTATVDEDLQPANLGPIDLFSVKPFDGTNESSVIFNGIQPGKVNVKELKEIWGEPAKIVEVNGVEKMMYKAPGFRQVDVFADGSGTDDEQLVVDSITIHLSPELSTDSIIEQLELDELREVDVVDEEDVPLGVAYPERAVLLGYKDDTAEFDTITLQSVSADLFVLRVESNFDLQYSSDLKDLDLATKIDDQNAHAYWLKSELYSKVGIQSEAKEAIDKAMSLSSEPLYRLTKARLLADEGEVGEARKITQEVVDDASVINVVMARAKFQLGNLRATGADADFESAMEAHLESIELAAKELNNKEVKVRRMAKDILVDAHLSVAQDIALGNFQRQQEVVPKWLIRATELAEKFIEEDHGEEAKRLDIFRSTLAIYSILPGNFDASVAAEDGLLEGNRLISQSDDKLFKTRINRTLIEMLYYAAKVEHLRGRADNALEYAQDAVSLIEKVDAEDTKLFDKYIYGQLYFLVGSLHAIGKSDHQTATEWYAKAAEAFIDNDFSLLTNPNLFGDVLVSMGVSYWEVGEKEKAVAITEQGVQLMQDGVQEGLFELEALAIPYSNLAAMHKSLGHKKDSTHYVEMAAKVNSHVKKR